MRRHDCQQFQAFTGGPSEFYARTVVTMVSTPHPVEPPAEPARRPRNFVRCMMAIEPVPTR